MVYISQFEEHNRSALYNKPPERDPAGPAHMRELRGARATARARASARARATARVAPTIHGHSKAIRRIVGATLAVALEGGLAVALEGRLMGASPARFRSRGM